MTKRPRVDSNQEFIVDLESAEEQDGGGSAEDELEIIQSARQIRRDRRLEQDFDDDARAGLSDDSDRDIDGTVSRMNAGDLDDGVPLEPFHLRNEREEGNFDESGFFMQSKEQIAETRDAWLDSLDESGKARSSSSTERSKLATLQREEFWSAVEEGRSGPDQPIESYLYKLFSKLRSGETVRAAMDRFLGKIPTPTPSGFKSTVKAKKKAVSSEPSEGEKDMDSFNSLTETADALSALGLHDILSETREGVFSRLSKITIEYRWLNPGAEQQIFGPFAYVDLMRWDQEGCFRNNAIVVRRSSSNEDWRPFPPPS